MAQFAVEEWPVCPFISAVLDVVEAEVDPAVDSNLYAVLAISCEWYVVWVRQRFSGQATVIVPKRRIDKSASSLQSPAYRPPIFPI